MDFYFHPMSAPCRAVMLTAKACRIELKKNPLDLMKGEHMTPEFLAINPQHTIPTIKDGDLALWESRAICTYLAMKSGMESLYPKDPRERANVDKLLYFDMGTLYDRFGKYCYPVAFGSEKRDPKKLEKLEEALGWLDGFLAGHDFAVGNNITVADHTLVASVTTMTAFGVDLEKYKNTSAWLKRCESQMPGYDTENTAGAKIFEEICKGK